MTTAQQIMQGDRVTFYDHERLPKTALVTATPDDIDRGRAERGGQVPPLHEGELHLTVFPPTGGVEPRHNIRQGNGPGQWEPREANGRR